MLISSQMTGKYSFYVLSITSFLHTPANPCTAVTPILLIVQLSLIIVCYMAHSHVHRADMKVWQGCV